LLWCNATKAAPFSYARFGAVLLSFIPLFGD
jgi:hypothetical protein